MVKMMTAYTEEVDEIEEGIAELLGQIDLGALKKNSVGIVNCHFDFIHSCFIEEMSKRLPFDIIGMTTMSSTDQHGQGMYALVLTVLTSDDLVFETVISESLDTDDYEGKIEAMYSDAAGKLPGKASLILCLFPHLKYPNGAELHQGLDKICGGIPIWGGVTTHTDTGYDHCYTFRNGDYRRDGMALLLIHGSIEPEFIVVSLPLQNIQKNQGKITKSDGCLLQEINGIPALLYLETLGIIIMESAPITMPMMTYYEGIPEPVALAIYAVNEDGSLSCGGEMTEGAVVAVGEITVGSVMASAEEALERVLGCGKRNGMLVLPCVSRYVMLSLDHNDEMAFVSEKISNGNPQGTPRMPFMMGYAGGEICPVRDKNGVLRNRFHNFTFSACVF